MGHSILIYKQAATLSVFSLGCHPFIEVAHSVFSTPNLISQWSAVDNITTVPWLYCGRWKFARGTPGAVFCFLWLVWTIMRDKHHLFWSGRWKQWWRRGSIQPIWKMPIHSSRELQGAVSSIGPIMYLRPCFWRKQFLPSWSDLALLHISVQDPGMFWKRSWSMWKGRRLQACARYECNMLLLQMLLLWFQGLIFFSLIDLRTGWPQKRSCIWGWKGNGKSFLSSIWWYLFNIPLTCIAILLSDSWRFADAQWGR